MNESTHGAIESILTNKMRHVSMVHSTKEENRAFITRCAERGLCSMPNYARQDAELKALRQTKWENATE